MGKKKGLLYTEIALLLSVEVKLLIQLKLCELNSISTRGNFKGDSSTQH